MAVQVVYKVLKTRLQVSKEDKAFIDQMIRDRVNCWNKLVERFNADYKNKTYPSMTEMDRFLQKEFSSVLRTVRKQAWKDYMNAWKRVYNKSIPKKMRREPKFHSIQYAKSVHCLGQTGLSVKNEKFHLSRKHHIRLSEPFENKPSGWLVEFTLSRSGGKYYVAFTWKEEIEHKEFNGDGQIGLDYGFTNFLTDDKGNRYNLPESLLNQEYRVKAINSRLFKKPVVQGKTQSKSRQKLQEKLQRAWDRYNAIKKDWIEKLTYKLCKENNLIAIEDLNLVGMREGESKSKRWSRKKMNRNSFSNFTERLAQKAHRFETTKVFFNNMMFPSSQLCSQCGTKHPKMKNLSVRTMECDKCGLILDRDQNAAKNLLQEAVSKTLRNM